MQNSCCRDEKLICIVSPLAFVCLLFSRRLVPETSCRVGGALHKPRLSPHLLMQLRSAGAQRLTGCFSPPLAAAAETWRPSGLRSSSPSVPSPQAAFWPRHSEATFRMNVLLVSGCCRRTNTSAPNQLLVVVIHRWRWWRWRWWRWRWVELLE